ncbi:MAG: RpiB/LacA/LacB family sugar-phosphate isomerase [Candidatus Wildermuthbacteria bacterium]|nr:RpiB/LacA/LacB family sugar-phosphate isomerase [Candidatus Wildermuthbacteria bacterium]
MKIYVGGDHAGFELKEQVKQYLLELGMQVEDMGPYEVNTEDDYPDFVIPLARKVGEDPEHARGILFGGSGQGEAIAANKVRGVRAAVYYGGTIDIITLSRKDNDANILSLGARFVDIGQAKMAVDIWLNAPFDGGERHKRRVNKIKAFEEGF